MLTHEPDCDTASHLEANQHTVYTISSVHTLRRDLSVTSHSQMKSIYIFIDSGFFCEVKEVNMLLRIHE